MRTGAGHGSAGEVSEPVPAAPWRRLIDRIVQAYPTIPRSNDNKDAVREVSKMPTSLRSWRCRPNGRSWPISAWATRRKSILILS